MFSHWSYRYLLRRANTPTLTLYFRRNSRSLEKIAGGANAFIPEKSDASNLVPIINKFGHLAAE